MLKAILNYKKGIYTICRNSGVINIVIMKLHFRNNALFLLSSLLLSMLIIRMRYVMTKYLHLLNTSRNLKITFSVHTHMFVLHEIDVIVYMTKERLNQRSWYVSII